MFRLFFLTILLTVLLPPSTFAQESSAIYDNLESRLLFIENPFSPQLPKKRGPTPPERNGKKWSQKAGGNDTRSPATNKDPSLKPKIPVKPKQEPPKVIPLPDVTISGIVWNSTRPQAIINGEIINVGDTILKVKVTNIRKSGIDGIFYGRPVTIATDKGAQHE